MKKKKIFYKNRLNSMTEEQNPLDILVTFIIQLIDLINLS